MPRPRTPTPTHLYARHDLLVAEGVAAHAQTLPERDALPDVRRVRRGRTRVVRDGLPTFDEGDDAPASGRLQADRLRHLHARATLVATPETPCSTQDIADVFCVREGDVRAARPASARRIGRAWMAPFGDCLVALQIDLAALAAQTEARRAPRVREVTLPTLRPLGEPTAARGGR